MTAHTSRLGLRLTLSAIGSEFDLLKNELLPFWEDTFGPDDADYINKATDQDLLRNLEAIKKRCNRMMVLAEVEQTRLALHMARHAVAAE